MERRRRARGRGIADDLITSRLHTSLLCNLRYYGVYLYEVGVLHFYLSQWPFLLLTRSMTCLSPKDPRFLLDLVLPWWLRPAGLEQAMPS